MLLAAASVLASRTAPAQRVTVSAPVVCGDPGATAIEVPISVDNAGAVRALSFSLQDSPDELQLVAGPGAATCTDRTTGFACTANEVTVSNLINTVVVSFEGANIAAGTGPVIVLPLTDGAVTCTSGEHVALNLANVVVADPNNLPLPATVVNGSFTCGCSATNTTSSTTSTTLSTTTSTTAPITTTSSSATTSSSTTPVSLPSTTSTTVPCVLSQLPEDSLASVECAIDAVRTTLNEPPQPACIGRCKHCSLEPSLDRIARLAMQADLATSAKKCKRSLKAARRAAKALSARIASLTRSECLAPAERAASLNPEAMDLANRTKALFRSGFCASK